MEERTRGLWLPRRCTRLRGPAQRWAVESQRQGGEAEGVEKGQRPAFVCETGWVCSLLLVLGVLPIRSLCWYCSTIRASHPVDGGLGGESPPALFWWWVRYRYCSGWRGTP